MAAHWKVENRPRRWQRWKKNEKFQTGKKRNIGCVLLCCFASRINNSICMSLQMLCHRNTLTRACHLKTFLEISIDYKQQVMICSFFSIRLKFRFVWMKQWSIIKILSDWNTLHPSTTELTNIFSLNEAQKKKSLLIFPIIIISRKSCSLILIVLRIMCVLAIFENRFFFSIDFLIMRPRLNVHSVIYKPFIEIEDGK